MKPKTTETLPALFGTLFFLLFLLPFFLIWIPHKILSSSVHIYILDLGKLRYLGPVPIVLGVVIYLWCSKSFVWVGKGTPIPFTPTENLIVAGLYRFVRNPMYIAGVLVLAGEALLFQSIGIFMYCLVMFAIFHAHILMEETFLAERYGSTYEQYRKHVPRWIPRLRPYRDNDSGPSIGT